MRAAARFGAAAAMAGRRSTASAASVPPRFSFLGQLAGKPALVLAAAAVTTEDRWATVLPDMSNQLPVVTGFVTMFGTAAYAYSLIARRDVRVAELGEKIASLEGKMVEKMAGVKSEVGAQMVGLEGKMGAQLAGVKSEVGAQIVGLEGKMAGVKTEVGAQMEGLEGKIGAQLAGVKSEVGAQLAGVKSEVGAQLGGVKNELAEKVAGIVTTIDAKMAGSRSEVKAAALEVMKDYGVSIAGGVASKS